MTFGYVNSTTNSSIIFDAEFILNNSFLSNPLILSKYIGNIENNLFEYESVNAIILSLPDKNLGNFIKYDEEKITVIIFILF